MIRLLMLRGKWLAIEIDSIDDDLDNIEAFVESGDVVALCADMETAEHYLENPIELVEP